MSLSCYQLQLLLEEIRPLIVGGFVQQVVLLESQLMSLKLRSQALIQWLNICFKTDLNSIYLTQDKLGNSLPPGSFVMALRKWLKGAQLMEIEQVNQDRLLKFYFEKAGQPLILLLELTGRHHNIFLLDNNEVILQQLRKTNSTVRSIGLGKEYVLPPPPKYSIRDFQKHDRLSLGSLTGDMQRSRAVQSYVHCQENRTMFRKLYGQIERSLIKKCQYLLTKTNSLEKDLAAAQSSLQYKVWAELLGQVYGQVKLGETLVRVKDYYSEDLSEVEIPLLAHLNLQENIERYFKRYKKYYQALPIIEKHLKQVRSNYLNAKAELEKFYQQFKLSILDTADIQTETLEQLIQFSSIQQTSTSVHQSLVRNVEKLPYRRFASSTGHSIFVGKSQKQNMDLVFRFARGNDYWFHARDWPGSHVIVRLNKKEKLMSDTLLEAATLAGYYCKTKSETVEIVYTAVKNLKKIKGQSQIQYSNVKSIAIRIEKARLNLLIKGVD